MKPGSVFQMTPGVDSVLIVAEITPLHYHPYMKSVPPNTWILDLQQKAV